MIYKGASIELSAASLVFTFIFLLKSDVFCRISVFFPDRSQIIHKSDG